MLSLINDEKYIINANYLLKEQIEHYNKNKLYLLNFDFFNKLYDRKFLLSDENVKIYYNAKIKNNLFYSLRKDYFIYKYNIPKWLFWLRKYTFFSYELYLLYYSLWLYINDLAKVKIEYKNLLIENLKLNKSYYKTYSWTTINYNKWKITTWYDVYKYNNHYNEFYKNIKKYSKFEWKNKIIIKLDLQNFFDDIDIKILLDFLDWNINNKIDLWFNSSKKDEIIDFFNFIWFRKWIPQSDDNIISSYLSDLYLLKSDFKIIDFLKNNNIKFSFLRYVDDTYLIFNEDDLWKYKEKPFLLLQKFWNIIYKETEIRLNNNKNSIFFIKSIENWEKFLKNVKNISQVSHITEEDDDWNIKEKVLSVFTIINNLKNIWDKNDKIELNYINNDINKLNSIFTKDKEWINILNIILNNYKEELIDSFNNFDFHYVNFINKPLLALIKWTEDWKDWIENIYLNFIAFIKKIQIETIYDIYIFLEFLLNDKEIFELHKSKILKMEYHFLNEFNKENNIINIDNDWIYSNIELKENIIEQIKYRIICEISEEYSKAFNHLLNEFQNIIFNLDNKINIKIEFYNQKNVKSFLINLWTIDNNLIINVWNFFDRRNKNNISHWNWISLNKEEYMQYQKIIFSLYKLL